MSKKIVLCFEHGECQASVDGYPKYHVIAKTESEAVGDLVRLFPTMLGIEIERRSLPGACRLDEVRPADAFFGYPSVTPPVVAEACTAVTDAELAVIAGAQLPRNGFLGKARRLNDPATSGAMNCPGECP